MPPALRMRYPFFPSIVRVLAKQLAKEPTELIHTQAQAGAHGAERQAQLRGSFAARQPAPEDQLDHLALGLRQRRQGHADLAPQQRVVDRRLVGSEQVHVIRGYLAPLALAAPAAQLVDRAVMG